MSSWKWPMYLKSYCMEDKDICMLLSQCRSCWCAGDACSRDSSSHGIDLVVPEHTHYCAVIMGAMASQITSPTNVYSNVYWGLDQRKHQSSTSLPFGRRIHRWPVNSPHKWSVSRKMFPFDDILILVSAGKGSYTTKPIYDNDKHYGDVIMDAIASQITSLTIVYSIVYSDADQRKHESSVSLAFVRGIHRGPLNSRHKWPVTRKIFPFDDVIMFPCILTTVLCLYINSSYWYHVIMFNFILHNGLITVELIAWLHLHQLIDCNFTSSLITPSPAPPLPAHTHTKTYATIEVIWTLIASSLYIHTCHRNTHGFVLINFHLFKGGPYRFMGYIYPESSLQMRCPSVVFITNAFFSLQWRYNGGNSVSNHQLHDCSLDPYSGADQRKHQTSASLAFARGIHRWPSNSPHKWPVTRKMFPFHDVIMSTKIFLLVGYLYCDVPFALWRLKSPDCLYNSLFGIGNNQNMRLALCDGNPLVTRGLALHMASNAERVSM